MDIRLGKLNGQGVVVPCLESSVTPGATSDQIFLKTDELAW